MNRRKFLSLSAMAGAGLYLNKFTKAFARRVRKIRGKTLTVPIQLPVSKVIPGPFPPPDPAVIMLGTSESNYDDFVSKVGAVPAIRIYTATQSISGSFWTQAEDRAAAGILPVVTTKRMDTAYYSTIHDFVATWAMRPILDLFHEPEDNIEDGEFTAATYRSNAQAFYTALHDVADIATCLMTWTWNPLSVRDPDDYWPGDAYTDILAVDGYQFNDASYPFTTWASIMNDPASYAAAHGKRFGVYEYGTENDTFLPGVTPEERALAFAEFEDWAQGCAPMEMALYWEATTSVNDYQFRDDAIVRTAYQNMMANPYFQRQP